MRETLKVGHLTGKLSVSRWNCDFDPTRKRQMEFSAAGTFSLNGNGAEVKGDFTYSNDHKGLTIPSARLYPPDTPKEVRAEIAKSIKQNLNASFKESMRLGITQYLIKWMHNNAHDAR
jgi:hypothetical protein